MFSNTEGTWLWAAQLNDDRNLAEVEQQYEQARRNPKATRPQLVGYDALRAEIRDLRNDIRRDQGLPPLEGPEGPMERIKANQKAIRDRRLGAVLGFNDKEVG